MSKNQKLTMQEPLIKIGLVLPEDSMKVLTIKIFKPSSFLITGSEKDYDPKSSNKLIFKIKNEMIACKELNILSKEIKIKNKYKESDAKIKIYGLTAGRGFHWQKEISASYWGSLIIKIYDSNLLVYNEIFLEQYLMCVSTSEMSEKCPTEFLKAQTIIARSWFLANKEKKHSSLGFDICNDDCCQRYHGCNHISSHSVESAKSTRGKVLAHKGMICDARYSKSCGGISEDYENVWQGEPVPYLRSINDYINDKTPFCSSKKIDESFLKNYIGNVDENGKYYRWQIALSKKGIIKNIYKTLKIKIFNITSLVPIKKGKSARIAKLEIRYLNELNKNKSIILNSEYEIRKVLSKDFLFSSAFEIEEVEDGYLLKGRGWGHGVGLCQIGALSMALEKYDHNQILSHYYSNTNIISLYK